MDKLIELNYCPFTVITSLGVGNYPQCLVWRRMELPLGFTDYWVSTYIDNRTGWPNCKQVHVMNVFNSVLIVSLKVKEAI